MSIDKIIKLNRLMQHRHYILLIPVSILTLVSLSWLRVTVDMAMLRDYSEVTNWMMLAGDIGWFIMLIGGTWGILDLIVSDIMKSFYNRHKEE